MMVESKLVVSIVYCAILTIAGILGVVSLGLFADAYDEYKNIANSLRPDVVITDYCFLFVSPSVSPESAGYGPNGVCNFVVAADVIALLLMLASGVAMVMTFIIVNEYIL